MSLTPKQKRQFKAAGQKMADDAHVGAAGLNEKTVAHVKTLLQRRELIKLRFVEKLEGQGRKSFAGEVASAVGAECVAVVGRTVLLYRAKEEGGKA